MAPDQNIVQNSNDNRMEWFIVAGKKNGKTYVPKTIPQNRNKTFIMCSTMAISLGFFLADILLNGNLTGQFEVICYGVLLLYVIEFIFRVILFLEEFRNHFTSRYANSLKGVLVHVFLDFYSSPLLLCSIFTITFIVFVFWIQHGFIDIAKLNGRSLALKFLGLCSLRKIMFLETAPIYSSLQMEVNNGLNYGSGMAYSFFYGYFKKVLSKACQKDENLQEKIGNYCDSQGVRFPVSKLLMLIPKSGTCLDSLKDPRFPDITESSSLSEKIDSVGGVIDRVYKNSVYKIYEQTKKKKVYVCVEYASPLVTFKKGLEFNGLHSSHYQLHQEDIILQFYLSLKYLVEKDAEISELCDLIYYDDKDENGNLRDVAKIILTRVKALKRQRKKSQ